MVRVADYIMQELYKNGSRHIFMVTGRGALFLSDAVAANENLHGISMHHEQSASFAASNGFCEIETFALFFFAQLIIFFFGEYFFGHPIFKLKLNLPAASISEFDILFCPSPSQAIVFP